MFGYWRYWPILNVVLTGKSKTESVPEFPHIARVNCALNCARDRKSLRCVSRMFPRRLAEVVRECYDMAQ